MICIVSKGGSKIHIYSLIKYQLVFCIWRGKLDEEILDISFSKKNLYISLVNSKNTIHIYSLDPNNQSISLCHCHEIEESDRQEPQGMFTSVFSKVKVSNKLKLF